MADLKFILQGLSPTDDHLASTQHVFSLPNISRGIIASAFMNAAGASIVSSMIAPVSDRIKVYVGVRNDVTTLQAIQTLMENGIYPILVDTATQAFIFHPKVYMAINDQQGRLLVGSANATSGGLIKNIEASLYTDLNMQEANDAQIADVILSSFEALETGYPDNVFQITEDTDLGAFVQQGILIDQNNTLYRPRMRATGTERTDTRQRMHIHTRRMPRTVRTARQHTETTSIRGTRTGILAVRNDRLLWKSNGLTRRDLNIPTGQTTNPTGSMLLKKGDSSQDIDPRSYFREVVFAQKEWTYDADPRTAHMERCVCDFRIIIKGVDYGVHSLQLSHNSRTDTRAYEQHNSMTQIHWGPTVKQLVAQEDLLGAILYLYAPQEGSDIYTLVFGDDE